MAIIGTGPIGLMALQSARVQGAEQVIAFEPAAKRQELARQCGATAVIDPVKQDPIEAIQVMAEGKFDGEPLITGKIGLDGILGGFDDLIKHKEDNVKILVSPR